MRLHKLFAQPERALLEQWVTGYDGIIIDEVQDIPNIGIGLKMLVDLFPDLQIVVSGSSSFSISQHLGEPLVGRQTVLHLYPISYDEMRSHLGNAYDLREILPDMLVYGMYPRIRTQTDSVQKQQELTQFTHALLLKDILQVETVK